MSAPLLRVESLGAGYAGTVVLWDVELEVAEGEVVAIIGRNGMGKTTLMRTLMGFVRARNGSIWHAERDVTNEPPERRARLGIGYVPQGRMIFPDLTVEENLRMGDRLGSLRSTVTDQFDRVYDMFPIIRERKTQKGGTLSGGQQQMLAIGRALVGDPNILLLDEPSEGIQPSIIGEIEAHVLNLKRQFGLTIFLAEQDCAFIRTVADRCYVLEGGRITATLLRAELADSDRLEQALAL